MKCYSPGNCLGLPLWENKHHWHFDKLWDELGKKESYCCHCGLKQQSFAGSKCYDEVGPEFSQKERKDFISWWKRSGIKKYFK